VLVQGMLGLGDNLHQRAVIRQLMELDSVVLETPWPSVYHDMVGDRLRLTNRNTTLRTQAKNAARERDKYTSRLSISSGHRIWYTHDQIRQCGGFLAAMCRNSGLPVGDFSMPVPDSWKAKAAALIPAQDKPIMFYRPLVDRTEWNGCMQRNPDRMAYVELAKSIRERFLVVSVADLEDGKEWAVSDSIGADIEFHRGELDFEALAGMMALSSLVFCSPGFALVMAQSIGRPMVAVFGGHESARLYDHGRADNLFIQPENPCECFSKTHDCDKTINLRKAKDRLRDFVEGIA